MKDAEKLALIDSIYISLLISASNTQVAELGLFRVLKAACTASAHNLPSRKQ
jgi:hypothetical protein